MKNISVIIISVIISAIVTCGIVCYKMPKAASVASAQSGSVYDRVMKNKTIRCGYVTWPPFFSKDVNTGKTSGFFHDYMEELGRAFGLKIDWVEEISLSDVPSALNTGRIDAFCLTLGSVPSRAVNMNFSRNVVYFPFYAYVRKDDTRFNADLNAINDPAVTLSTMEGEYTSILARTTYPKAKILEITSNQGSSTLFLNVANKKADVIFQDPGSFASYDAENPGILRKSGGLVGAIPVGFPLKLDDAKIQRLFDYGVADLENRRITKRLLEKYKFIGGAEPILYATMPGYQAPMLQPVSVE